MTAKKTASHRSLKSDLARVDAHKVKSGEYDELPELNEEMLTRAQVNKGGRPVSAHPRKLLSLRLPAEVIERWKATGPGWQTRMAERLEATASNLPPQRARAGATHR
ncbi:MAG: BrnA antitoxin family protein [Betaproteobacteria bacterium]